MKKIGINKIVNLELLTEELYTAFPSWVYPGQLGLSTKAVIEPQQVTFPDTTPESEVQAIIDAHDPNGISINQQDDLSTTSAKDEFVNAPPWIKDLNYDQVDSFILTNTVGAVTETQAHNAVNNAASLDDVKVILNNMVTAIYGLVGVNRKLARVLLAAIFFVRKRVK